MSGWELSRKDILTLRGYRAAEQIPDSVRLNANEAPRSLGTHVADPDLNRYPNVHPVALQERLAGLFGVSPNQLLVTRGSSEAIDVVIRSFCRAYTDNVVTVTPTFEMYRFYADVQGVEIREVPLNADQAYALNPDDLLDQCDQNTKVVFVCSPNNPTGNTVSSADIVKLAEARRDKSIVVVDEAYIEFSGQASVASLIDSLDNLVVLRTLSKAHALAGARCGAAIACAELNDVFCRVLPPYSFPTPVVNRVLETLADEGCGYSATSIAEIVKERDRLYGALQELSSVSVVWPSEANFLLVRFVDMNRLQSYLLEKRILVRDFSSEPGLENCARITVGSVAENNALLDALTAFSDKD